MKKQIFKNLKQALIVMLVVSLIPILASCQDREVGMNILEMKPVDPSTCLAVSDEGAYRAGGVVDLTLRTNYEVHPMVENNMVDTVEIKSLDSTDARVSTNSIVLRSAVIEYTALDQLSANIQTQRIIPLSGTIGIGERLLITGLDLFSSDMLEQFRSADEFLLIDGGEARPRRTDAEIIAHIRLKGETLDGREIESNEFLFPVRVCNGCMITYPADMLVDRSGVLTCPPRDPSIEEMASPSDVPLCPGSLGSDDSFVDCQTCQGLAIDSFARQLCQPPQIP